VLIKKLNITTTIFRNNKPTAQLKTKKERPLASLLIGKNYIGG